MKKLLTVLLSFALVLAMSIPAFAEPTETQAASAVYGDANDDSVVNMKDVLVMRKYLGGLDVSCNLRNSDVNADDAVNMKDVLLVRKFVAGIAVLEGNCFVAIPTKPLPTKATTKATTKTTAKATQHVHKWIPITTQKWVVDKEAYDEEVVEYINDVHTFCSACACGLDFTAAGYTSLQVANHAKAHMLAGDEGGGGWYSKAVKVPFTNVYHYDEVGHYEEVVTGYQCASCGATK